jgi:hypothetical protein
MDIILLIGIAAVIWLVAFLLFRHRLQRRGRATDSDASLEMTIPPVLERDALQQRRLAEEVRKEREERDQFEDEE